MQPSRCPSIAVAFAVAAATLIGACTESSSSLTPAPDSAGKCALTATAPPMMAADGGTANVSIATQPECAWTASTTASWISGLSPASSQGSGTVSFRVAPNDGSATREAVIAVNDSTVRVSQRAPCRFDLSPSAHTIPASGGSGGVTIAAASECGWTASADVNWISLAGPLSGSGTGSINFTVAPNGGADRGGAIIVGNQRSTVFQAAGASPPTGPPPPPAPPNCTYSIAPASQNIGATGGGGGPVAVSTQTGCPWTASSGASWITVTSGASGVGNGSVAFTVAVNSGGSRTGSLTIAGRGFTVTQAASPPCSYNIAPGTQKVAPSGATASVAVTTGSTCAWTAASNASWLTITSGASGVGNGSVTISVARNDGKDRKGTLTIAGKTATIEQDEDKGK